MRRSERGAVVVETALTVGLGLMILLFSLELGIIGFLQITADSAAFVDAHYYAIGTSPSAPPVEVLTHNIFPQVAVADIKSSPQPAPTILIPVDYQFNGTVTEQQNTNGRHAGVTMLEPILYSSTVKPHSIFNLFGKLVQASGTAIEAQEKECGPHYNVAEANVQCGSGTQPAGYSVNPIPSPQAGDASAGENTPPYYLSFNFRLRCGTAQPWSHCSDALTSNGTWYAFGVGEYLDANNWGATNPGASGSGSPSGPPTSTFEYMLCHQQVYSKLASFFNTYSSLAALNTAYVNTSYAKVNIARPTTFQTWNEFDSTNNALVTQVYGWDAVVSQGAQLNAASEPGATPLHPGLGC